jgi:hypothetical protein
MRNKILIAVAAAAVAAAAAFIAATGTASAGSTPPTAEPQILGDSSMHPSTTTIGGADVLPTTRTVAHFFATAANPSDGVTYGYNMVGANPFTCTGAACSTTIPTDIVPLNINVGGQSFNGTDVVNAVLASPQFANDDYATTSRSTAAPTGFTAGGPLSSGNSGVQLEDATMRSQFNRVGSSNPYHVILGTPVVHPAITINVPANHGTLLRSARGVVFGDVNITWFASQLNNIITNTSYIDPTHLPVFITDEVMLYFGSDPFNCCVIGFHGASKVPGNGGGSINSNGNAVVQTYAWASFVTPGTFNPDSSWALQDIHALSHEIAEWGDDPFINNTVQPWLTPTAPQYGCTGILETGDPVVGIGFSKGTNTFRQGPAPNGRQIADGTYHPEDEVFLPWFMRTSPNTTSQATQTPSTNVGRYTLMGDLNPYPGFRQPATGC